MKKVLSILLVAVMLLGVLTGCGKKKEAVKDEIPDELTKSNITIKFYHSMGAELQGILEDAIADFNKTYPNIKIEHTSYGDYDGVRDQIKTEITVGDQPNLAYCYPDHVALYNISGVVRPLDDFIADKKWGLTDAQKKDFIPGFYNEGKAYEDGKMYTLPLSKSTEVLYYNKTFFEEHNLEVPKTWDEMEAVCAKIREIDPTCIPLGYDSESNWFITMCEQTGSAYTSATGEKFLFNNAENREFVERFRTWYDKKWVTTEKLSGGYTSSLFTGESSSGTRCYMCIGSSGGATYQQPKQENGKFEFEVGIESIPQINPDKPKVISQGPSVCVFRNEDPQKVLASWLFAKFLSTNVDFQCRVSMNNGYMPVTYSAAKADAYVNFLSDASTANIQAYAVQVSLDQADAYYVSPAFYGSSVARDQVGLLMQKCLLFTGSSSDVAPKIKKAFEDAVKECKYQSEF